ncbi:MAG: hypothetical protein LC126_27450 [Bryobacterales bacterium]|nr:hypothetical protein [Bryobacterales bacterium]
MMLFRGKMQGWGMMRGGMPAYLLMLGCVPPAPARERHPVTQREIAVVMGFGGAPWLERSEREQADGVAGVSQGGSGRAH